MLLIPHGPPVRGRSDAVGGAPVADATVVGDAVAVDAAAVGDTAAAELATGTGAEGMLAGALLDAAGAVELPVAAVLR